MPGTYTYALGAWRWDADYFGGLGCYVAPAGAVSLLDYRNDEQMGQPNRTDGYGLFAIAGAVPEDLVPIGYGYAPEEIVTPTARQEVRTRLGLSGDPAGNTLAEMMLSIYRDFGDPSGVSFARPIDPTTEGHLEIWLTGHSCVHREAFDVRSLLAASPTGTANRLRELWRRKLDAADDAGKLPEALGALLLRCGYSRAEIKAGAKGRQAEWRRLLSDAAKAKHGAGLAVKDPKTSLAESWPNASVANINGTTQSLPWVTNSTTMPVVGNRLRGTAPSLCTARCTSAVSSADHWAEAACYNSSSSYSYHAGPICRFSDAAATYYAATRYLLDGTVYLLKLVAGSQTVLASAAQAGTLAGNIVRVRANGSTISSHYDGAAKSSVTDTAITGNLFGGAYVYPLDAGSAAGIELGAIRIDDDLASAPAAAFSATPLSGLAPLSVAFTDASTNTPTSWLWERSSDGGANWSTFSTSQNPTAEFTAGTWAVRLTATNAGGSDGETKLAYITVSAASSGHAGRLLMGLG